MREAPLFVRGDEPKLEKLLCEQVGSGDGMRLLPSLVRGRYAPSKQLIDSIARSLRGSPVWTLLDEQRLAYNIVRGKVARATATGEKAVVIVVGGPGTGKSVIAAHLYISLAQSGNVRVTHATGSKAFTTNLRALSPSRGGDAVFRYFHDFSHKDTKANELDLIVCDEAHRIRVTSNSRYTKKALRSDISQVRELIRAARVSVFFLDERQNVRPNEIGTVEAIAGGAREEGVPITRVDLNGQFRCNGCAGYVDWVDGLLSPSPQEVGNWLAAREYDLRVLDSPAALERAVQGASIHGNTGRLVAGFCWPWSDPEPDGSLVKDVAIGSWKRPWNEKPPEQRKPPKSQPAPGKHPYYLWATQPKGEGEVGCIYSAQGFEFDYCGVILGNDLVWRGGVGWVASRDASFDPQIRRRKLDPDRLGDLLRHTYRVLLTRGMKGTFVYSTDYETLELLRGLVR
jgi:Mrp family chromosome partitioning ATPase